MAAGEIEGVLTRTQAIDDGISTRAGAGGATVAFRRRAATVEMVIEVPATVEHQAVLQAILGSGDMRVRIMPPLRAGEIEPEEIAVQPSLADEPSPDSEGSRTW